MAQQRRRSRTFRPRVGGKEIPWHVLSPLYRLAAGLPDYISLGVIAKFFPIEKIREILEQTKRASVRERDLPAQVVVYYVIALAL